MDEVLERAKKFGFFGIEIDGKRPGSYPLDWPKQRCVEFHNKVMDKGLVISNVAAYNDFSSPIPEHREAQLSNVKEQIRMTADFNTETKALRVFFGWPGVTAVPGAEAATILRRTPGPSYTKTSPRNRPGTGAARGWGKRRGLRENMG